MSRLLQAAEVAHCFIEGDNLDQVFPAPPDDPVRERISEANLRAVWANYRALGQTRLVYTNTAAVLSKPWMNRALGGGARFIGALLTASDATAAERLAKREVGGGLGWHIERSRIAADWLERSAPSWVTRVSTDGVSAVELAQRLVALTGWMS